VSGPAVAADAGAEVSGIEQIVVTARRREENLQNVPVAITALTAEQLQEQNVRTLEDMTAYVPNIKVNAGRATSSTINAYIRGVGQNDPLWGFEPGVGIYMDDVYIARPKAPCSMFTTSSASKFCAGRKARCTARTRSRAPSST
jgi:iron complex outermembrane receptor protein